MELLVWILIAGLVVWFVLIPALALWIAIHVLGQEEDNDGNAYDVSDSHGGYRNDVCPTGSDLIRR